MHSPAVWTQTASGWRPRKALARSGSSSRKRMRLLDPGGCTAAPCSFGRAPGPGVACCAGGPAISVPNWGVFADSGGREEPDAMSEPLLDRPPPVVNVAMLRTIVLPGAIRVVDSRGSVSRAGRAPEDGDSPA